MRSTDFTPGRPALLLAALLLAALLLAAPLAYPLEAAMNDDKVPTLTVNGDGEVRQEPDLATVRVGVQNQDPSASDAQLRANQTVQAILDGVGKLDIASDAVQTSRLTLTPVYDNPGRPGQASREPRIAAYRASNVVSIRLTDLTKVGPVLDAAIAAGANSIEGVDFQLEDDAEARREALKMAVREARAKAEAIAEALGVALGPVLSVQEGGVTIARPQLEMRAMAMSASADTPVSAGQVGVSASVTVRYRLGN